MPLPHYYHFPCPPTVLGKWGGGGGVFCTIFISTPFFFLLLYPLFLVNWCVRLVTLTRIPILTDAKKYAKNAAKKRPYFCSIFPCNCSFLFPWKVHRFLAGVLCASACKCVCACMCIFFVCMFVLACAVFTFLYLFLSISISISNFQFLLTLLFRPLDLHSSLSPVQFSWKLFAVAKKDVV